MIDARSLRHLATIRVSNLDKKSVDGQVPVRLVNYTDVYHGDRIGPDDGLMTATATPDQLRSFRLERGDVVITKDSEDPSDIAVPAFVERTTSDLVCGYHLAILRPRPEMTDGRYLYWAMQAVPVRAHMATSATGITRYGLRTESIAATPVPWHPVQNQRMIADFLDAETARIDALIAKKRRLTALLGERVAAVRERALEPRPGWEQASLGRFVRSIGQGVSPQAGNVRAEGDEWGLLKLSAVKAGQFIPTENKALPSEYSFDPRLVPQVGDLLVTRSNTPSYVGDVAAVTAPAGRVVLCDLIYRLRLTSDLDPTFAAQVLLARAARAHLASSARGTSQSMVKLRGEDIKATPMPVLDVAEQQEIVHGFQLSSARHVTTVGALESQIGLLQEHRQALIAAAVTGEIEVGAMA